MSTRGPASAGLSGLLVAAAASGAVADRQSETGAVAAEKPRSILFYLIDTCRADRLSAWGHERETSPFLEELAGRGVRFENCFSQAPWTKPSMSAILTSCYPSVTGMHRLLDQLDSSFVTMPEAFRAAGWYTAGFSANPLMGRLSNYNQGFQRFLDAALIIRGGDVIDHASGSAAALNGHLLPWIGKNREWPFFLYAHSIDPHEEYEPAPDYLAAFADPEREAEYREQWRKLKAAVPFKVANHCTKEHFDAAGVPVEPFIEYGLDLYDADIRANDDQIARVIDALEERGQLDDMIVVVTADHGEEFMEHGGTSHAFMLWNELIHVPLLIVAPGLLPEGLVVEEPVQSLDIYPTLLELCGIDPPEGLQGGSFAPLLRGEPGDGRPIFAENHELPGSEQFFLSQGITLSVIEGPWKYILNIKSPVNRPRPRHELYRLDHDFGEARNLAEEQPAQVERFEGLVLEWWARNRARHEGVDVASLTEDELREADPETLERLRKLGYLK